MHARLELIIAVSIVLLLNRPATAADAPDFLTAVGHVKKFENNTLTVNVGEKSTKSVELSVTGTSKFHLLAPQNRAGKTVITQRSAETSDLAAGQSIAVIYTTADKDNVLLTAVIKAVEKATK
jgi:hypothetical protein